MTLTTMPTFPFFQIDVFTKVRLAGNPCAVVLDADELTDDEMLKVAVEMNLSETVFICRSEIADYSLRYFTPAEEIPLAGHPTIAAVQALIESGCLVAAVPTHNLKVQVQGGVLPVRIFTDGSATTIEMEQFKPIFLSTYSPEKIVALFRLDIEDLLPGLPIQTVSTGTPQLMVPVKNLSSLRRATLMIDSFTEHRRQCDYFSAHLFCLESPELTGKTFARHFCAPPDVMEDPFTGSATGGMAAYLWHYNLIDNPHFIATQGHFMGRPGSCAVEVTGPRAESIVVRIKGTAVACVTGTLTI